MKHFWKTALILTGIIALASCQVGLGSMLNLQGPVVTITSPTPEAGQTNIAVGDVFNLSGTISGENKVTLMEITMAYFDDNDGLVPVGREWRWGANWQYKEDNNVGWRPYYEEDYKPFITIDPDSPNQVRPSEWWLEGSTVHWNLPMLMDGLPKVPADYYITISAEDAMGHRGANSTKKVKVSYDNEKPNFAVLQPVVFDGATTGAPSWGAMYPSYPLQKTETGELTGEDLFDTYVYDTVKRPEDTYQYIQNWKTRSWEFEWKIDKDMIGDYNLAVEFTNRHNLANPGQSLPGDEKKLYFRYQWDETGTNLPKVPQLGIFTDRDSSELIVGLAKIRGALKAEDIKLLDPDTALPIGGELPKITGENAPYGYTPIQVVSRLTNATTGISAHKSNGWFAYLPEADKPWALIDFGDKFHPDETPPNDAGSDKFFWQNRTNGNNVAYDNEGVKSLTWELFKLKDGPSLEIIEPTANARDGSALKPWTGTVSDAGTTEFTRFVTGTEPRRRRWSFRSDSQYGVGRFKIVVTVTDVRNVESEPQIAYFTIESNETPTIRKLLSPLPNKTLWGNDDGIGNFDISGIAQIEDSDEIGTNGVKVDRVSIAWIKPANAATVAARQLKYTDRSYANWDAGIGIPYFEDDESKVWEVSASSIEWDPNTDGNGNEEGLEDYAFSHTLNLFTDLNIGRSDLEKNPFSAQVFLIRFLSNTGSGGQRTSVVTATTQGDIVAPVLTINKITITSADDRSRWYENLGAGFSLISRIGKDDKIQFEGTWDDDSWSEWTGIPASERKDFFKDFGVTWKGQTPGRDLALGGTFNDDGTWVSAEHTFAWDNTDAFITINANLTDLNTINIGNVNAGLGETLIIETNQPTLVRISSENNDGSYGGDKNTYPDRPGSRHIELIMEFNNPVKFFDYEGLTKPYYPPAGETAPSLILNNGGRAFYSGGNSDSKITFRYFVDGNNSPSVPTFQPGFDGDSTDEGERLNVEGIDWGDYPLSSWVSIEGDGTQAIISNLVFDPDSDMSLAANKNIVIDKDPPVIKSIATAASVARPYGKGGQIYITVKFDEQITVADQTTGTRANPGNFYLNLSGGNLVSQQAKALYANVAGKDSVSFLYTVGDDDDTSAAIYTAAARNLSVLSVVMDSSLSIKDAAGNEIIKGTIPAPAGGLGRNINIDTVPPTPPTIQGNGILANNYGDRSFTISGTEATASSVEYHQSYPNPAPINPPEDGWITPSSISNIPLDRSGTYRIAARQYDNAVPPNKSDPSTSPLELTIDKSPIFTRLSSSMADGAYGYKAGNPGQVITIDLYFRIPLNLSGNPYLVLNTTPVTGTNNRALLQAGQTGGAARTTWTFAYTIPGANVTQDGEHLDVTEFVLNGATFSDAIGIPVNDYIGLSTVGTANRFNAQKNITIQAGYPTMLPTNGFAFTANQLRITFDRDISAGDVENQLIIKQIATGYRIPAVLSEARWNELFLNRTDIWDAAGTWPAVTAPAATWGNNNTAKTDFWQKLGDALYQKGSNGANPGSGNELVSDTGVKYVLRYDINSNAPDNTQIAVTIDGLSVNVTMAQVRSVMRAAEALRFNPKDKEVSIDSNNRRLVIELGGDKQLPVKGTRYQFNFPRGFVKDSLEKPNGGASDADYDAGITSGNPDTPAHDNNTTTNPRTLGLGGYEAPVIRINKGEDIEQLTGGGPGANRQAVQPLTTQVRIDGRTPNTTFAYQTRSTTDNVGRLLFRNGADGTFDGQDDDGNAYRSWSINNGALDPTNNTAAANSQNGIAPYGLPNLGNQHPTDFTSYDQAKNRPQSGNAVNNHPAEGMNHWQPMGSSWEATATVNPFDIGTGNYNDGGMIVHIHAWITQDPSVQAYESAYRSVFVFHNSTINNNGTIQAPGTDNVRKLLNLGVGGGSTSNFSIFDNPALGRMWIRGGDTIGGDPSVPDFPISRNRNLARKARLMTPIDAVAKYADFNTARNASVTNADIPPVYRQETPSGGVTNDDRHYPGAYLWFWVTWKINVNAYIDPFGGELPVSESVPQVPQKYKELYKGIMPSKEHYPLIPGRTTVFETRRVYRVRYGGQGGQLDWGALATSPTPTDL